MHLLRGVISSLHQTLFSPDTPGTILIRHFVRQSHKLALKAFVLTDLVRECAYEIRSPLRNLPTFREGGRGRELRSSDDTEVHGDRLPARCGSDSFELREGDSRKTARTLQESNGYKIRVKR